MSKRSGSNFTQQKGLPEGMKRCAQDLIYLASCSFNKEPVSAERCAGMDLKALYFLAEQQGITAATAFALEQVTELPHEFDQAKKKAIRRLALYEIERGKIFREFERRGIRYLPLKGIVIKDYYPKAAMREMSDNDILCQSDDREAIKEVMTGFGFTCEYFGDYHHDVYSKLPMLEFEIHRTLFDEEIQQRFYDCFLPIWDKLEDDGGCRLRMTNEDFYLFLVAHIYKHYESAGTGLRSLADVYLFCKAHDDLRRDYLDAELDKMEIKAFEHSFSSLAQKVFTAQPLNEKEEAELTYLIMSGVYGSSENIVYRDTASKLQGDDSNQAKRRFFFSRLFVSGEFVKTYYPFVYRHKVLYPLLLVYRPIKGIFTHPKVLLGEYKRIKAYRKSDEIMLHYEESDKTDKKQC